MRRSQAIDKQSIANGLLYGSFCAFMMLASIIFLDRVEGLRVTSIAVRGSYYIPAHEIHNNVLEVITKRNCLRVATCDHILWYPEKRIAHELFHSFPRIDSVEVTVEGTELLIDVTERSHVAIACYEPDCWFIDAKGIAFAQSPKFSSGVYTTFVMAGPAGELPFVAVDPWIYPSVSEFIDLVDIESPVISRSESDITLRVEHVGDVEFPLGADILVTEYSLKSNTNRAYLARVFAKLWQSEKITGPLDAGRQLQYIDLRFDGKVFYKFSV
jgi:hypothetical protein